MFTRKQAPNREVGDNQFAWCKLESSNCRLHFGKRRPPAVDLPRLRQGSSAQAQACGVPYEPLYCNGSKQELSRRKSPRNWTRQRRALPWEGKGSWAYQFSPNHASPCGAAH